MDKPRVTYPSPEMSKRELTRLSIAAQAPFIKPWHLPSWLPVFVRQFLNGFERIDEFAFEYYCKWAAWEQYDSSEDWRLIAARAILMAHGNGDSRLWLVWRWANTPGNGWNEPDVPDWMD